MKKTGFTAKIELVVRCNKCQSILCDRYIAKESQVIWLEPCITCIASDIDVIHDNKKKNRKKDTIC